MASAQSTGREYVPGLKKKIGVVVVTKQGEIGGDSYSYCNRDLAARFFPRRDATEDEARVLGHGGPLRPVGIDVPYAVFDPAGHVLAIVAERDGRARAQVVLAPAGSVA